MSENVQRVELEEVNFKSEDTTPLVARDISLVKSVPITVDVEIGSAAITLEQLFSMSSGEVLSLDKDINAPIDIKLQGQVVAQGNLVAVDGAFGVEITHIKG